MTPYCSALGLRWPQVDVQRPGDVLLQDICSAHAHLLTSHVPCLRVQALALQDVMGLLEGEVHCSIVSEASILRIAAGGTAADAADSGADPSGPAPEPAVSARSGANAPSGQPRRFSVCDGQRQNNRSLQPREWLAVPPVVSDVRPLRYDAVPSCCIEGAPHGEESACLAC